MASATDRGGTRTGDEARERAGGAWALLGVVAGVVFAVAFFIHDSLYPADVDFADNAAVASALVGSGPKVLVVQVAIIVTIPCLVVFGAGLRRRLAEQEPTGSLTPGLAQTGVSLTAAALLVSAGINAELWWNIFGTQPGRNSATDPDSVIGLLNIVSTVPWAAWVGVGLTAGATATAAARGSLARWMGWSSAVLAGLLAILALLPILFLSVLPACLWLIVAGIGLWRDQQQPTPLTS